MLARTLHTIDEQDDRYHILAIEAEYEAKLAALREAVAEYIADNRSYEQRGYVTLDLLRAALAATEGADAE